MTIARIMKRARRPDGPGEEPGSEIQRYDIGHVVDVLPDDWQFTPYELTHPAFQFVKLPGPPEDYEDLVECPQETQLTGRLPPRRIRVASLAALSAAASRRADPRLGSVWEINGAAFRALCEIHDERGGDGTLVIDNGGV